MTRTFFTADTHFGHGNIIAHCRRPFIDPGDIELIRTYITAKETPPQDLRLRLEAATILMNEEMIKRWNEVVGPDDNVWHLGDVWVSNKNELADDYLRRLNGRKHLIRGNHDPVSTYGCRQWVFSEHYCEGKWDKTNVVMSHYAMRVWNGSFKGKTLQLHGHSHGMLDPLPMQCDVGVDCWDFRPVTIDQIRERVGFAR